MPQFLELTNYHEAITLFLANLPAVIPAIEWIKTQDALHRILGETIIAPEPLPAFSRSTVDGYAVMAADTYGASASIPVYLNVIGEVPMGSSAGFSLSAGQTGMIHTGGMLPAGSDAVVMIEDTQISREGEIEIYRAVGVGDNIILAGEDVRVGDEVLQSGLRLRPAEIGGLLALGFKKIPVTKALTVAIISSGDEVISPEEKPGPGQVRDINSFTLRSLIQQHGGNALLYGIAPDNFEAMQALVEKAHKECDMVIITAGSSASSRDMTAEVIRTLGSPGVLVHGVRIRPGKPTILAVCDGKPVIGLPGNPVSALVIASLFVVPALEQLAGFSRRRPAPLIRARLAINVPSVAGRDDFIPVRLSHNGDSYTADPIFFKSNMIFTLAQADGLLHVPADAVGLGVGEWADIIFLP